MPRYPSLFPRDHRGKPIDPIHAAECWGSVLALLYVLLWLVR